MPQHIRDVMTSNPCTIDAEKSVAYAAEMMREEDVGLAPIVEGDKLIGMLTDRDIATRVAAQGRNPDQVKVREVASTQLVTVDPDEDLDQALRKMAKHQVRRVPVVDDDGTLVGVIAQADIAREGDHEMTGQLVEEISESGGQMSSFEERQYPMPPLVGGQLEDIPAPEPEEPQLAEQQPEEPSISKVQSTSRGRKRAASPRKRKTAARKTAARKTAARKSAGTRKRKTAARKAAGARKRKTAARKSAGTRARSTARRSTAGRKRKTTSRKRATATRKRKTAARKSTASRKRKTTARKSAGTRKRKTASRKRATGAKKRTTARRATTTRRKTTARKTSARKTSSRRRTTRRK